MSTCDARPNLKNIPTNVRYSYKEISHGRGVVANRSKLSLSGTIGFIVWLSAYVDYALTSMSEKRRADPMDSAIHYVDVRPRA